MPPDGRVGRGNAHLGDRRADPHHGRRGPPVPQQQDGPVRVPVQRGGRSSHFQQLINNCCGGSATSNAATASTVPAAAATATPLCRERASNGGFHGIKRQCH